MGYTPVFRQNAARFTSAATTTATTANDNNEKDSNASGDQTVFSNSTLGIMTAPAAPLQPSDSKGPGTVATMILNTLKEIDTNQQKSKSPAKKAQPENRGGFSLKAYIEKTTGMGISGSEPSIEAPTFQSKKQPN